MDVALLAERWERVLGDLAAAPGSVLYSAHETLRPGKVLIIGVNPGGEGSETIGQNLRRLSHKRENAYLDECWESRSRKYQMGMAPLQRRLNWIVPMLGDDLRNCCATNLIFTQSRNLEGLDLEGLAKRCWPVLEDIIGIVRPAFIVAFGNSKGSPYEFLRAQLDGKRDAISPAGHGSWRLRRCVVRGPTERTIQVLGFPHLSWYKPERPEVQAWLSTA